MRFILLHKTSLGKPEGAPKIVEIYRQLIIVFKGALRNYPAYWSRVALAQQSVADVGKPLRLGCLLPVSDISSSSEVALFSGDPGTPCRQWATSAGELMENYAITAFDSGPSAWTLSQAEAARQAIASRRGYIYHLHASVAARIPSASTSSCGSYVIDGLRATIGNRTRDDSLPARRSKHASVPSLTHAVLLRLAQRL